MAVRILSALIALPAVIALIELGGFPYLALILFASTVCLFEFGAMAFPNDKPARLLVAIFGVAWVLLTLLGITERVGSWTIVPPATIAILVYFLLRPDPIEGAASRMGLAFLALAWSSGLLVSTAMLRLLPRGESWFYLACILAWGSDTGAYFAGRFFGKRKLYERVSPKKTWAGAVGGVVVATAGALVANSILGPGLDPLHLAVLAPPVVALGQMGDLAESLLKRSVGVKDSGHIMPGHGGILDRIDALLFAGPVLLAYAILVRGDAVTWIYPP